MMSSCPSCLTQVEHADSEMQVTCPSCAEIFSPFLTAGDAESHVEPDFAESTAAFQDIVAFGEATYGGQKTENTASGAVSPSATGSAPKPKPKAAPTVELAGSESQASLLSCGMTIPGQRTVQTFAPVSIWADLDANAPLEPGLQLLQSSASSVGANAILDFRFSLSADGARALLFGIPALCQPE